MIQSLSNQEGESNDNIKACVSGNSSHIKLVETFLGYLDKKRINSACFTGKENPIVPASFLVFVKINPCQVISCENGCIFPPPKKQNI